jgi:uncharacterized protein (DUF885 family)
LIGESSRTRLRAQGEAGGRDKTEQLRRFFEDAFQERVNRSPQTLTALGIKTCQDQLDDLSESRRQADHDLIQDQLRRLQQFDLVALAPADQLNVRVFKHDAEQLLARFRYRFHDYLVNQKFGLHTDFPAFMINMHGIADLEDARNYIARLHALEGSCRQVIDELDKRASLGVTPPAYLFPQMIGDCENFIDGASGGRLEHNVLYEDFQAKLGRLEGLAQPERGTLLDGLKQALQASVIPAYERLTGYLKRQQGKAPAEAGAWSLPEGDSYYKMCLQRHTSTALSADEIHQHGVREAARIQGEMLQLKERIGFRGSLQDVFSFAREHPDFYYPQTEEGRQHYLDALNATVAHVRTLLPGLFNVLPRDELLVKAVERHREKTAGLAFYEGPAAGGSRPGIFYVNLYDLRQLPSFTIEALAYHEALPGHHMQFSIANGLQSLPTFRRYTDDTAYIEGWGLYSELLMKEAGLYHDPWSDFGRLAQELKRACRLVVDTGIHARRWTRQQAIDYMVENIPSSRGQLVKEVERYIVMPGQATAYTVGMAEILRLRSRARTALGGKFDLREFHDELLRNGPLPLFLLEESVAAWMRARR